MRLTCAAVLLTAAAFAASPADIAGTWKVRSTWPNGPGLKTVGDIVLDLKVDGGMVTGMAHIGSWPGDAPIAEGKLEGNRLTFNATGHLSSSTGIPTCHCEVTIESGEMLLTMTMIKNPTCAAGTPFQFKGRKQPE